MANENLGPPQANRYYPHRTLSGPGEGKVSRARLNIFAAVDFRVSRPGPADSHDASTACGGVSPIAANPILPDRREMRLAAAARENSLRHACVI